MIVSSDMSLTPRATIALQVMGFPVVSSKELIVDTTTGVCVCVFVYVRCLVVAFVVVVVVVVRLSCKPGDRPRSLNW